MPTKKWLKKTFLEALWKKEKLLEFNNSNVATKFVDVESFVEVVVADSVKESLVGSMIKDVVESLNEVIERCRI